MQNPQDCIEMKYGYQTMNNTFIYMWFKTQKF